MCVFKKRIHLTVTLVSNTSTNSFIGWVKIIFNIEISENYKFYNNFINSIQYIDIIRDLRSLLKFSNDGYKNHLSYKHFSNTSEGLKIDPLFIVPVYSEAFCELSASLLQNSKRKFMNRKMCKVIQCNI